MLYFLRICAGLCRRFFFFFPRQIECRFSFQSLDARSARTARFLLETSCDDSQGVQRDDGSPRE
jgi:hypothetical protein